MRKERRRSVLLVLAGLFLLLAIYLLSSENPWSFDKEILSKIEAGESVKLKFQVALGLYLAAAVNLILITGLLVAWWFFDAKLPEPDRGISTGEVYVEREDGPFSGLTARSFWLLLAVILMIGGGLRWHLASSSLWWDELWSVKQGMVGAYVPDKAEPGQYEFKEATWERAAWYYRKPTNHAVASLSAKLVDTVWRNFNQVERHEFRDIMIRLPMLLCSLAAMLMVAVLGRRWKMPWAGLAGALLLALHPWYIRYGVDARAYTFVVLWTVMGCYWLTAIADHKNRSFLPWFMFGVNQFLLVWSFPQAVWVAGGFFLAAVVLVFVTWRKLADRLTALWSLLLVNVLAGGVFLQMFAPNLLQIKVWLEKDLGKHGGHELNVARFQEFLTQSAFGLPVYRSGEGDAAGLPSFVGQMQSYPVWMWLALFVLAVISLMGLVYLMYVRRRVLLIISGVIMGGVLAFIFYGLAETYFYHRFIIFLIVPVIFFPAMALEWWVSARARGGQLRAGLVGLLLIAGVYSAVVWPQIKMLNERSYAPLREVAEYFQQARGGVFSDPNSDRQAVIVAVYGHGGEPLHVYDPEVKLLHDLSELQEITKVAEEKGARLLVAYDHRHFNEVMLPDGFEWLDDGERFKQVASYPAIEPEFFFRILEYVKK